MPRQSNSLCSAPQIGATGGAWHRRMLVWTADDGRKLRFMYQPIITTLRLAAQAASPTVDFHEGTCFVEKGYGHIYGGSAAFGPILALTRPGDLFIWIGQTTHNVPFQALAAAGALTVHYFPDAIGHVRQSCASNANETWTYTWRNIDTCREDKKSKGHTWRLIPPGAHPQPGAVNASLFSPLVFLGKVDSIRKWCWQRMQRQQGMQPHRENMKYNYSVWDAATLRSVLEQHSVFLSMHKSCNSPASFQEPFEAFRASTLLSAGALMICELSYPKDRAMYDGMVSHTALLAVGDEYSRLRSLLPEERRKLSAKRQGRFQSTFDPVAIFARAGVYDLLRGLPFR